MQIRIIAAALVAATAVSAPSIGLAETHIVEINGMAFTPAALDVAVGDTVTWVNNDIVPHTATAADGSFDSGSLAQGGEFSFVVESAGPIDYACLFHPQMSGVINGE